MKVRSLITFTDPAVEWRSIKSGNVYEAHMEPYRTGSTALYVHTPGGDVCLADNEYELIDD